MPFHFSSGTRGEGDHKLTLPDKLTGDLRVREATTLPAEGKGRWDGVRQGDKEGAGSTEITGLERPEVEPAASRRHVTGGRDRCGRRPSVSRRGGFRRGRAVAAPSVLSVSLPFLNFVFLLPLELPVWAV